MNDEQTLIFEINFTPTSDGSEPDDQEPVLGYLPCLRDAEQNGCIELATSTGPVPDDAGRQGQVYSAAP